MLGNVTQHRTAIDLIGVGRNSVSAVNDMAWGMVEYVVAAAFALAAVGYAVYTPIEARKARDGWVRERFKGTREEFVAHLRRRYSANFKASIVAGAIILVILIGLMVTTQVPTILVPAIAFYALIEGIIAYWCRRILDSQATHTAG